MNTEELLEAQKQFTLGSSSPVGGADGVILESGKGLILKDTNGKEYLDFSSALTCVNLGYGRKDLAEVGAAEMAKMGYWSNIGRQSTRATIEYSQKLKEVVPDGMGHFFFSAGGSEAVDSAFKIARAYWRLKGRGKYKIITLQSSYHGVSMGVVSATTAMGGMGAIGSEPLPGGFLHLPHYHCYRCPYALEYPGCDTKCARMLEILLEIESEETVAAFCAEPVQGVGGRIIPPPTYWPIIREICTKHNVLLISDEVMTGFCRTGKMFAVENFDLKPDILVMAKGITNSFFPYSITAINDEMFYTYASNPKNRIPAFVTFGAHPVGSAIASKCLDIYKEEKIAENATTVGKYLLDRLQEFMKFPHVGEVHGIGLFCSIDLVKDKTTKEKLAMETGRALTKRAVEKGLIVRGGAMIGLTPPLTCTKKQVDQAIDILKPIVAEMKV